MAAAAADGPSCGGIRTDAAAEMLSLIASLIRLEVDASAAVDSLSQCTEFYTRTKCLFVCFF